VACSQIQPHPDFWKSYRVKKNTVEKTKIVFDQIEKDQDLPAPSMSLSEWNLISKSGFASREYELIFRDQEGKLIDSKNAPEIKIEGPVKLIGLSKISEGSWKVTLEYLYDPAIVKIGFQLGPHRVDYFKQIQYQLHEIDYMESKSYTQKAKVRADGVDKLRVYVVMRDKKGYNIFSTTDFHVQLLVDKLNAKVTGPFSAAGGPYFEISSKVAGPIKYSVEVDGQALKGEGVASFMSWNESRTPAAENKGCLENLALLAGIEVPNSDPVSAYEALTDRILALFEEKHESHSESYQATLEAFSTTKCTSNKIWDAAREEAGRKLRVIRTRISR